MSGDKNSSMDTTLPVPLRKSPGEVVSSSESSDEEFLRDTDQQGGGENERFLAELTRRRALVLELLARDAGDDDDSFSLDGNLIPCPGNVAFRCVVGYHKESLSTCPFCESLWAELRGQLMAVMDDEHGDAEEDEDVGGDVDH